MSSRRSRAEGDRPSAEQRWESAMLDGLPAMDALGCSRSPRLVASPEDDRIAQLAASLRSAPTPTHPTPTLPFPTAHATNNNRSSFPFGTIPFPDLSARSSADSATIMNMSTATPSANTSARSSAAASPLPHDPFTTMDVDHTRARSSTAHSAHRASSMVAPPPSGVTRARGNTAMALDHNSNHQSNSHRSSRQNSSGASASTHAAARMAAMQAGSALPAALAPVQAPACIPAAEYMNAQPVHAHMQQQTARVRAAQPRMPVEWWPEACAAAGAAAAHNAHAGAVPQQQSVACMLPLREQQEVLLAGGVPARVCMARNCLGLDQQQAGAADLLVAAKGSAY